jgi:hypothetical protein
MNKNSYTTEFYLELYFYSLISRRMLNVEKINFIQMHEQGCIQDEEN